MSTINFRNMIESLITEESNRHQIYKDFCANMLCVLNNDLGSMIDLLSHYSDEQQQTFTRSAKACMEGMEQSPYQDILTPLLLGKQLELSFSELEQLSLVEKVIRETNLPYDLKLTGALASQSILSLARDLVYSGYSKKHLRLSFQDENSLLCNIVLINTSLWGIPGDVPQIVKTQLRLIG